MYECLIQLGQATGLAEPERPSEGSGPAGTERKMSRNEDVAYSSWKRRTMEPLHERDQRA